MLLEYFDYRKRNRINLAFFWSSSIGIEEADSKEVDESLDLADGISLLMKNWTFFSLTLFFLYSQLIQDFKLNLN